jgi:hypothetical protein
VRQYRLRRYVDAGGLMSYRFWRSAKSATSASLALDRQQRVELRHRGELLRFSS